MKLHPTREAVPPMIKNVLFQLHWIFGITAGLVLAVVGVTGGLLSFEDEILEALNPGILSVEARPGTPQLTPAQLIEAAKAGDPAARVNAVTVSADPEASASATLAPPPGQQGRGRQVYLDPYTGAVLGDPGGRGFFQFTEQLHRYLVMGGNQGPGKIIVGVSTIILVFLAITGIYLRWPRRFLNWRAWFKLNFKYRGRPLYWNLHAVIGVYVFLAYLLMGLTGLWWSFDWYRNGASLLLTGKPAQTQQRQAGGGQQQAEEPQPPVAMDAVWTSFLQTTGGQYDSATVTLPRKAGEPVQIRFFAVDAAHNRAADQMRLNAGTGAIESHDKFADKSFGEQLYGSVFALHSGSYFGVVGVVLLMLASFAMPVFFITGWLLYLGRRKHKRQMRLRARQLRAQAAAAE